MSQEDEKKTPNARAPLCWLEKSLADPVARHFAELRVEPTYEAVAAMAPPYKYVNASFKVYPLVLGEKEGAAKVRLLSDASALHLGIEKDKRYCGSEIPDQWFGQAFAARFAVGAEATTPSGEPVWMDGHLPVANFRWEHRGVRYTMEAFAALLPCTSQRLAAFVRLGMARLEEKAVARWQVKLAGESPLSTGEGYLYHATDKANLLRGGYSNPWRFDAATQTLTWELPPSQPQGTARLVLLDQPAADTLLEPPATDFGPFGLDKKMTLRDSGMFLCDCAGSEFWQRRLDNYTEGWKKTLTAAAQVQVPEPYLNNAHRSARIAAQVIASRNAMVYSAHNWYERMYFDESAQASVGLAYWGHLADAARYLDHAGFYTQIDVTPHDFGSRLHWYCRYVTLTGDADFLARNRPRMERWAGWLLNDLKEANHGLLSPTGHSGDLHDIQIFSLSSNCLAWRGLRDFAVLTNDLAMLARVEEYRTAIRRAADATVDRAANPPFLPMSLYGQEPTPTNLMESSLGAYWCLMAPYALYANALGDAHEGTRAMIQSLQQRGGLCAGLVRFTGHGEFGQATSAAEMGIDDLYGAKLSETVARLDEPDQLVLALYGKLGLGMTKNTFISGETGSLAPSRMFDAACADGRSMTLPPNSASQMFLAILLRHCLVYDFDSREDGRYDTLRLAFATPRAWLEEGKQITVRGMPTAFGPVSFEISSALDSRSTIEARVELPSRRLAENVFLRLRTPKGKPLRSVRVNGRPHETFDAAGGTIDLSGLSGKLSIEATIG